MQKVLRPNGQGGVVGFDPRRHAALALARHRLVMVGLAVPPPKGIIVPGSQIAVMIDGRNQPQSGMVGLVYGDRHPQAAAGRILQQIAYRSGLPPGHAGVHYLRGENNPTPLASDRVKELVATMGADGDVVGYMAVVKADAFDGATPPEFGNVLAARHSLRYEELVRLTLADISRCLGPDGLDGLRDPISYDAVAAQFRAAGLRAE